MLEALGSPGERSILSEQTKAGNGDEAEEESREDGEKRDSEEKPGSHQSLHSEEESRERTEERRRAEEEQEEEPDADLTKDNKGEARLSELPPVDWGPVWRKSRFISTFCSVYTGIFL